MKAALFNSVAKIQPQELLSADRRFLTIAEFTHIYGPCRTRVYQLLNDGELKAVKSGRLTLIPLAEAEAWASRLPKYQAGVTKVASKAGQS